MAPDCLLIDGCDFETFPPGGPLQACRQVARAFGTRLALVGISTRREVPVGVWTEREIDGIAFPYFAASRRAPTAGRPLVPARLAFHLGLRLHRRAILALGVRAAFVHAPETLLAVARWDLDALCVQLHGVENPLERSRYAWARPLAPLLDHGFFSALSRTDVILASADATAIAGLVARSGGRLRPELVRSFPTRFDATVFRPGSRAEARSRLGLGVEPLVVVSGRLSKEKGWGLVLDAFERFARKRPGAVLAFLGDGEERAALEERIRAGGASGSVRLLGSRPPNDVAEWLRAADVAAVGSFREGWSIAVLEALACGRPVVSTDVSGARALIENGRSGFVLPDRDPDRFAAALDAALTLPNPERECIAAAAPYDVRHLAADLGAAWRVLA